MRSKSGTGAMVIAVAALAVSGCASKAKVGDGSSSKAPDGGAVKLGVIGPLTGPAATYGVAERNGIQIAVDQVNASGGLLGKKVQVEVRDDKGGDPGVATTAALQLVQSDHVSALFGPIVNTAALAVAKMSDQLAVPVLGTLGATTPVVYPKGQGQAPYPWVYRVLVSSPVQVDALAKYGASKGWKRWSIVYENDAYGLPTVDDLKRAVQAHGGSLVAKQAISVDATDATAQALAIRSAHPDAVVVWSIQAPASKVVAALARANVNVPVLSSNAQLSPQFFQLAGKQANGIIATALKAQLVADAPVRRFEAAYKKRFGIDPTLWAFASYDAANVYLRTVKRLGNATPSAVRGALDQTDHTGLTGRVAFTKTNHEGIGPAGVAVVKLSDGKTLPVS